jgi:hypothetical protein
LVADVDLADTDLDGDNDVVFCVGIGAPGQRFNDGHGNFDAIGYVPTASVRFENELLDMNANHAVDLVYYEPDFFGDSYFGTMYGDGKGKFSGQQRDPVPGEIEVHRRIALGDITGDGLIDAVFTSVHTGGLRFIEPRPGRPVPDWKLPQLVYAPPCNDAVIADLDRDGRPDVVATARDLDSVAVFLTSPAGQVGTPHLHPAGDAPTRSRSWTSTSMGSPTCWWPIPTQGTVQVLRGLGTGELGPARALRVGQAPDDIATADFDNDGDIDAVIACAITSLLLSNDALSPSRRSLHPEVSDHLGGQARGEEFTRPRPAIALAGLGARRGGRRAARGEGVAAPPEPPDRRELGDVGAHDLQWRPTAYSRRSRRTTRGRRARACPWRA